MIPTPMVNTQVCHPSRLKSGAHYSPPASPNTPMLTQHCGSCATCIMPMSRTLVGSIPTGTTGITKNGCLNNFNRSLTGVDRLLGAGSTPSVGQSFFINNRNQDNVLNTPAAGECDSTTAGTSSRYPHTVISSVHYYPNTSPGYYWFSICSLDYQYVDGSGQVRMVGRSSDQCMHMYTCRSAR